MNTLGISEKDLYYKNKSQIINNPRIRGNSAKFRDSYYFYKEMSRDKLINESRNKYFHDNNYNYNNYYTPNNSHFDINSIKKRNTIHNSKLSTDYWSCRYDIEKENDRIYFLKRQNITQIKNLIDETLKLRKKSKFPKHNIYTSLQEKKNLTKKKILERNDKLIKDQEKIKILFDSINKKEKEKEFNKECKLRKEIENMQENFNAKQQKEFLERQKLWQKQNLEHQKKVEHMHKIKHKLAVDEYMQILKKGIERFEKIDERKNEMSLKYQKKNHERNLLLINYKMNTRIKEKNLREKFEKKHKNISKFYFIQKELRKDIIYKNKKVLEENSINNYNNRLLNKSMENNRRKKLLDLFEKNEHRIGKHFDVKKKQNEEYKFNNMIKSDEIYHNYLRNKNILNHKNQIKWQQMQNKDIEIYNKILTRQNSAINRISRFDDIKEEKNIMMKNAKNALEEYTEYQRPQDVYNRVFTHDEMQMLQD